MKIKIEIDRAELQRLAIEAIRVLLPYAQIEDADVRIETKSQQNYKAEWEVADFRARIEVDA